MEDAPFDMWVSDGEGVSGSMKIIFKSVMQVTSWKFKNRENPGERTKAVDVEFDDGSKARFELKNTASKESFTFEKAV